MMEVQAKVAIRINVGNERFITNEEIANTIKRVMKGEEAEMLKMRIGELNDKAVYALSRGCSILAQVTHVWKSTVG